MIKNSKTTLIVTSIIMLIPILIGLTLWDKLPEQIPSHWDINGNVDKWSSKSFVVFAIPSLLLAIHWLCIFVSCLDPKSKDYHPTMIRLVLWICPAIGLLVNSLVYTQALGYTIDVGVIMSLFMGLLFLVVGNLLPKCRQSYTLGIKLPWTLSNEENWNKTHRLGGKLWVAGGIVILVTAFVGSFWILMGALAVMVIVPTVYSYWLYLQQKKAKKE